MNPSPAQRQRLLLVAAATVAALYFGDKLLYSPLKKSWERRQSEIASLEKSIRQGRDFVGRENSLRARWNFMRTNTLPEEASAAENQLFKAIDDWSRASRISVVARKPQWKRNADDFLTLDCRIDALGSLSTITEFLYEIEKNPLALKIDSIELTPRDPSASQLSLNLQVNGLLLLSSSQ